MSRHVHAPLPRETYVREGMSYAERIVAQTKDALLHGRKVECICGHAGTIFRGHPMIPGRIEGATRRLGAPRNWDKERDGPCCALPIRDEPTEAGPGMTSVWQPTPDELARLAAGASIYLTILGTAHPPVSLAVGDAPQ